MPGSELPWDPRAHRWRGPAGRPGPATGTAQSGFTLLEVVVALLVFALAFGVVAQILQTGIRQSGTAEATTTATLIARSQLARVGIDLPLEIGVVEGDTADGFRWRTTIDLAEPADDEVGVALYLVEVTVTWGEADEERDLTLTSLRLGPLPGP